MPDKHKTLVRPLSPENPSASHPRFDCLFSPERVYCSQTRKGEKRNAKTACICFVGGWTAAGRCHSSLRRPDGFHPGYPGDEAARRRWGDLPSLSLASWLAEHEAAEGTTVPFDAEGSALFSNLSPGLYLIRQTGVSTGNNTIPPFVIELPYEDIWEITVRPQTMTADQSPPPTGQEPSPVVAAVVLAVSGTGLLGMAVCTKRKRATG